MSDRLVISLATIPMISGVLLLGLLQRGEASQAPAIKARSGSSLQVASAEALTRPWIGVVTAGSNADLGADFDGRVTHVYAKSGAKVTAGDKLLEINRDEIAASVGMAGAELGQSASDAQRAQARLEAAQQKLKRIEEGGKWLSAQEIEAARMEARVAQADLGSARAAVQMHRAQLAQQKRRSEKHTLVAPFSGTLVSIDVDEGDTVAAGQVLARVISDERLIRFALPREDLAKQELSEVLVRLQAQGEPLRVPVHGVRPEIDAAAQLVFATAALPEQVRGNAAWMPGSVVEVLAAPAATELALPQR
jgi:RND family efflux transporter MFP subunit